MTTLRAEGSAFSSSSGIVVGCAQKLSYGRQPIPERHLRADAIEAEQERLAQAIQLAVQELDTEHAHLVSLHHKDPVLILEAHRMLLLDPELIEKSLGLICHERMNAEWALRCQMNAIQAVFERIEDEYLRSKKSDVEQVGNRIMRHLIGQAFDTSFIHKDEPMILISEDFSPAEIVSMWRLGAAGIICEQGGINAHSIIIARGIGLPALIGASGILEEVEDGDIIVLDAERERWTVNPSTDEVTQYQRFMDAMDVVRNDLYQFANKPSQSGDGHKMAIMANLEFHEELTVAIELGAEGIGLYRTEFVFMQDAEPPCEQRQFEQYAHIVQSMKHQTITIRLLDIGGDKPVLFQQLSGEKYNGENPAMGLRGVRMLLQWPDILKTQIRAILRASQLGRVNILLPMVSHCHEVLAIRAMIDECRKELNISNHIAVGSMIEIPAAALIASDLAKVSDFFSIGTNDLIQYTLAADRCDDEVCHIYNSDHPAILQLIKQTVQAAKQHQIPVAICGELAANPEWTQSFLDLGMDSLSMSPNSILKIRKHLSKLEKK
ncbi:MAG: phosphoenolpyruvate--protein phosphotransferase [Mariprofundaceae bacterium]